MGGQLDSWALLDAVTELQARDVAPIPGVGYYAMLHPYALRGLIGESGLDGYIDVMAQANAGALTKGAVGQYRGVTFLPSTKFTATAGQYPVVLVGAGSIAAGDTGTLSFHSFSDAGVGNELQQLMGIGFKSIFGAKVLDFSESADGSGTNGATVPRAVQFTCTTGVSGEIS